MTKYQQLKIAKAILKENISDWADELECQGTSITSVAQGKMVSARIESFIDAKIDKAEKLFLQHIKERQNQAA